MFGSSSRRYADIHITTQPTTPFYKQPKNERNEVAVRIQERGTGADLAGVPLKVEPFYGNFESVEDDEFLQIMSEEPIKTDERGEANIVFRINELSSHHRPLLFCLKIEVDADSYKTVIVEPAFTSSIRVMSVPVKPKQVFQ